ncbi:ABC-2 type transport system ATP-binding protein [Salinibacillus kushneri]|uniref:ABC-2 type transport system ATP-binding protein n=2 Tax=Salinibacillus kushneri TaxID=237682 RepID=A0A1H9Y3G2_9BACI|nr:ABC transporter ATP-binding protein [Salinibacillus kushneri]SES63263.1 ABC-2 type transport system ATP-binding protein [Salinibacillus kushneri]
MIKLEEVHKKYWVYPAIKDITLSLEIGRIFGIIGENGSGKSTLLRLMAGLLKPTKGVITINGEVASRQTRKHVAYLSDQDYYFPYFTIEELIQYYHSQFSDFDSIKAKSIIDFLSLEPTAKIGHLSKGNRGRVKMVMTLSRNAPFLILDEPFSGLDPMVRKSILQGLIQFVDLSRQSVILTTHELKEVESVLDVAIVLKEGKLMGRKPVEQIREEQKMSILEWMENLYQEERESMKA